MYFLLKYTVTSTTVPVVVAHQYCGCHTFQEVIKERLFPQRFISTHLEGCGRDICQAGTPGLQLASKVSSVVTACC